MDRCAVCIRLGSPAFKVGKDQASPPLKLCRVQSKERWSGNTGRNCKKIDTKYLHFSFYHFVWTNGISWGRNDA